MSCFRGILVGLSLVATVAQAEEAATHMRTGVWRKIEVPLVEEKSEPGPVPELHVAPGWATLLIMPVIIGPDGFKVFGGDGRVGEENSEWETPFVDSPSKGWRP